MMASMGRVVTMAGMTVFRAYRSLSDVVWILVLPVVLSLVVASWFSGAGPSDGEFVVRETARGLQDAGEYLSVRGVFGVHLIFVFSSLITRAGAIHRERKEGRLDRTLACGIPYHEAIAAHVASIALIGLIQVGVFVTVTGALGVPWLLAGRTALLLPIIGVLIAGAGIATGIAGVVRTEGVIQLLSAGAPSLLALLGGAFFPLELAPANVQRVAVVNPIYWSMVVLDGGYAYEGIASQIGPFAVLLLFGALGLVIGIQGFRRLES